MRDQGFQETKNSRVNLLSDIGKTNRDPSLTLSNQELETNELHSEINLQIKLLCRDSFVMSLN